MLIRTRLAILFGLFFALLLVLAAFAIIQVNSIQQIATVMDERWLPGTAELGEVADSLSEFRLAETYRMLADNPVAKAAAEALAEKRRATINGLVGKYGAETAGPEQSSVLGAFRSTWAAYLRDHDAWIAGNDTGATRDSTYLTQSGAQHGINDAAIDGVIASNFQAADADSEAALGLGRTTLTVLIAMTGLGMALAAWALFAIRTQISRPLTAITEALSDLAIGRTDTEVPGVERQDEIGKMTQAFEVFRRNAWALQRAQEAAEAAQQKAQVLARSDALTHLPNRRVLSEELQKAINEARRGPATFGIFLLDLDRFKPINDLHGHAVGDMVLTEIAARLKGLMPKGDTIARLGGDEFGAIVRSPDGSSEYLESLAASMIRAIGAPFVHGDKALDVGATIGIARCPADGTDAGTLLRSADIAMYSAKRNGHGTYCFFEPQMDKDLRERAELETDIRAAVAAKQIVPYYQPLVTLADERLYGFEILARWQHPVRGSVSPEEFIPIIEEMGLIADFTYQMLRRACLDARDWPPHLTLSLNVSPLQLKDNLLPARLLAIFSETGFAPGRLEVEITERALVDDLDTAKTVLTSLQNLGVRIALDDFGAGYSSLYHLRELKLDKLKIDRSFVLSMRDDPESAKLVNGILRLSQSLGLQTTAEGIEDAETLKLIADGGCEFGQGFFFAKALSATDALATAKKGYFGQERREEERAAG